jgi:ferredoxin
MGKRLSIEPLGRAMVVEEGQTLLESALAQGVRLRGGCRISNRREWIARVAEGRVRYRIEWPKLSPEEQAAGITLPCVALAQTDVVLVQSWVALKG